MLHVTHPDLLMLGAKWQKRGKQVGMWKRLPSALPQIECLYRPVREGKVWGRCHGKCLHSKSAALFKSARRTSGDVGTGYYPTGYTPTMITKTSGLLKPVKIVTSGSVIGESSCTKTLRISFALFGTCCSPLEKVLNCLGFLASSVQNKLRIKWCWFDLLLQVC